MDNYLGLIRRIVITYLKKTLIPLINKVNRPIYTEPTYYYPISYRKNVNLPPYQVIKGLIRIAYKLVYRKVVLINNTPSDRSTLTGNYNWFNIEFMNTEFENSRPYRK